MAKKMNLKEMEKQAFRDSNQDGLIEIVFGIIFFSIAGYTHTKDLPILLILLPICGPMCNAVHTKQVYLSTNRLCTTEFENGKTDDSGTLSVYI
jgi:hypothetical protein